LTHALIAQETDALGDQVPDSGRNVDYPPPKDRVVSPRDFGDCGDAEHGAVRIKHAREVIVLNHGQTQRLLIEHPRPGQVGGRCEGNQIA
jgi:hypothetical protein